MPNHPSLALIPSSTALFLSLTSMALFMPCFSLPRLSILPVYKCVLVMYVCIRLSRVTFDLYWMAEVFLRWDWYRCCFWFWQVKIAWRCLYFSECSEFMLPTEDADRLRSRVRAAISWFCSISAFLAVYFIRWFMYVCVWFRFFWPYSQACWACLCS